MKHSRFSEEQIIAMLKENKAGTKVDDLCRLSRLERGDVLCLAEEVWRHGAVGCEAAPGVGDREHQAQADRRRSGAGHVDDERAAAKTLVSLWRSAEPWAF
jgi:hypothetical protein